MNSVPASPQPSLPLSSSPAALSVSRLCKDFPDFSLQDVSFTVPEGMVVGLIGENGSGKSTCIRCILNQDIPTSGTIEIFGQNSQGGAVSHEKIGVALDQCPFPETLNSRQIARILNDIYTGWDSDRFFALLEQLSVPLEKPVKSFSRGMKTKLTLCTVLSHQADLLILDEATAGLDPVVREEILDLLMEFMEDESHAILMTSHITSDLERIADYIVYIQDGKILFTEEKAVMEQAGIARVRQDQLPFIDPDLIVRLRRQPLCLDLLIKDRHAFGLRYPDYVIEPARIDDVILMYSKGEILT